MDFHPPVSELWASSEEIARLENTTPRGARKKYLRIADSFEDGYALYVRHSTVFGGRRLEFNLALLDAETQQKYRSQESGVRSQENFQAQPAAEACPSDSGSDQTSARESTRESAQPPTETTPPQALLSVRRPQSPLDAVAPGVGGQAGILALAPARQMVRILAEQQLALIPETSPIPDAKRPLADARYRIIEPIASRAWRLWLGQEVHNIEIKTLDDFVRALTRDYSKCVLLDWRAIEQRLKIESNDARARVGPLSASSLWRLWSWYQHGRPRRTCGECRAAVDQKTSLCSKCGKPQRLPAGKEALQDLDRSDKGEIRLAPAHAKFLTAAFTGGDASVKHSKLALERPRSAADCLRLLELEINVAARLDGPVPSYYQVTRWVREFLPRIISDSSRHGRRRALAWRGPKIPRVHDERPNDLWYCDFRQTNIRAWIPGTTNLVRLYLCCILDAGSRDVVFCYDFHPSAQLFKSTLRKALLAWGIPRQVWMDNGKEFLCEEISGGARREWRYRFQTDDETWSLFDKLGVEAHYAKKFNPNGKALVERFFQTLNLIERDLPGWTGEHTGSTVRARGAFARPERLKEEERIHDLFLAGESPETPLWPAEKLIDYELARIEAEYLHKPHDGLDGRTPAQVQAAFDGERRIPHADELSILLWHRKRLRARGDRISFEFRSKTLIYRTDELLALAGDCEVEVHVDPLNADRALALTPDGRTIALDPVNPAGRSPAELAEELKRQARLERKIHQASLAASRMAYVPGPEERLSLLQKQSAPKQSALDAARLDTRTTVSLPAYAEAANKVRESGVGSRESEQEKVFTSRTEYEQWQSQQTTAKP